MTGRNRLRERLLDLAERFHRSGARFQGPLPEAADLGQDSVRADARVLAAVLEAYAGEKDALVSYTPRDPLSPIYECASDLVVATPEIGCVLIEVKSHGADGLRFTEEGLAVVYPTLDGEHVKPVFPQLDKACQRMKTTVASPLGVPPALPGRQ